MTLRAALTTDLPLKLTSLVLSVFLWFLAAGEEPVSTLATVDLSVRPPVGRTMLHRPAPVRALVVGPRRELLKLAASPLRVSRVLPDTAGDEVSLDLAPGDVELPRGVNARIQDIQPHSISIDLDATSQRVVPVYPVVRMRDEAGFTPGRITVVPGTVRLFGPDARIRRLDSVRTEPLEVDGAEGPVELSLALDTTGLGPPVRILPPKVTVRVDVEAMRERVFSGVPVRLASAGADALAPALDSVTVRVRGRAARLRELDPDSVVVLAEWRGRTTPRRVALRVVLPPGVTGRAEPDSVDLVPPRPRG